MNDLHTIANWLAENRKSTGMIFCVLMEYRPGQVQKRLATFSFNRALKLVSVGPQRMIQLNQIKY